MIVSLLSGIIRNARNRRAAKKAQTEALNSLSDQQAQLDNIFNNEYYGDYMNRSDVQSMMRSMQDQMRQQNAQNYNMAASKPPTCAMRPTSPCRKRSTPTRKSPRHLWEEPAECWAAVCNSKKKGKTNEENRIHR